MSDSFSPPLQIKPHGLDEDRIDYNRANFLQHLLRAHNRMQQDEEIEGLCKADRTTEKPPEQQEKAALSQRLSQDNANAASLQGLRVIDSLNYGTLVTLPDDEAPSQQDPLRPPPPQATIVAKDRPKPPVKSNNRSRTPLPVPPNIRKPWLDTSSS